MDRLGGQSVEKGLFDQRYVREVPRPLFDALSPADKYFPIVPQERGKGRRASCLQRTWSNLSSWETWGRATFRKPSITRSPGQLSRTCY